ncbi:hypothetical protein [Nocardia mexicana]|uniref:SMI1/KNR4 family protein SUKH-1 n=1 Tax=Nocardia mexicana TaxID=279262 RepID=A0A370GJS0_9NOCA|nr:hypothetical protein [Nocardia mexicana]RDI43935.1 hypothetical protein DFR68_118115 [Nocardia mexicana]
MEDELRVRLNWIRGRLDWLRERDALLPRPFDDDVPSGGNLHSYLTWPVHPDRLSGLESVMAGALDPGFREFLTRVGVGAGPYCGISWERMVRSANRACAQPFPGGEQGTLGPCAGRPDGGFLVISDVGYGDFIGLVVAGPARGRVVYLGYRRGEWSLGPAFLDYYQSWLNHAAARLNAEVRAAATARPVGCL